MPKPPNLRECCDAIDFEAHIEESDVVIGPAGVVLDGRMGPGKIWREIHEKGLCTNCGERIGSVAWGSALAMTHGGGTKRCKTCVYKAQTKHVLKQTAKLPKLLCKLAVVLVRKE